MSIHYRQTLAALAVCAGLASTSAAYAADPGVSTPIDGTVIIRAHSAAVGIGYTWGDGVLKFHGRRYSFTVKGVDVAAVGYSTVVGHGRVYNLHKIADFSGTYGASTGEATLVNGIGGQVLVNAAGVQLRVDDVTKGARLSGAADGIQLALK